jgi:hypothetical protein
MKTTTEGLEAAAKAVAAEMGLPVEAVRAIMRIDMKRIAAAVVALDRK